MLSRLVKDSTWLLVSRVCVVTGAALFTILVARRLGREGFGEYAFMAALLAIGNMLTTFGTDMYLIREIAARQDLRQLPAALALQIMLSVLFVVGLFILPIFGFQSLEGAAALRIFGLSLLPLAFITVCTTALRGRQRMQSYSILNMASAIIQLAVACIFYYSRGGLIPLAWLLLSAQMVVGVIAGILCAPDLSTIWGMRSLSGKDIILLVRASAPMASLSALTITHQRLIPALLPVLAGAQPAGIYSAGARLVEMAKLAPLATLTAMYPMMAESKGRGVDWFRSFRPPVLILLAAAALAGLALFLFAGPLVVWLFGEDYAAAIPVVRILAWIPVLFTLNTFLSLAFLANDDEAIVAGALTAGLLSMAVLTIWWGEAAGAPGAAWAALYAEIIQSSILLFQAVRHLRVAVA